MTWPPASNASRACKPGGEDLIRRLVFVAFFLEVGLLLLVLPWSAFWEHNYFAGLWPSLQPFMGNNFVRGAVSGLGVINLYAAFAELVVVFSHRDHDVPLEPR